MSIPRLLILEALAAGERRTERPPHPGEMLADYLEELGLSQYRLAQAIRVPPRRINEIVHGKRGITADTALRLGLFFGTTAELWSNMQASYELDVAAMEVGDELLRAVTTLAQLRPDDDRQVANG